MHFLVCYSKLQNCRALLLVAGIGCLGCMMSREEKYFYYLLFYSIINCKRVVHNCRIQTLVFQNFLCMMGFQHWKKKKIEYNLYSKWTGFLCPLGTISAKILIFSKSDGHTQPWNLALYWQISNAGEPTPLVWVPSPQPEASVNATAC